MRIPSDFLLLSALLNYMFNLVRADPETSRAATLEEEERRKVRRHGDRFLEEVEEGDVFEANRQGGENEEVEEEYRQHSNWLAQEGEEYKGSD